MAKEKVVRTGLLLLQSHLLPIDLHTVPERHPKIGLLLRGHILPSLLDIGKCRVRDCMSLASLLLEAHGGDRARRADGLA